VAPLVEEISVHIDTVRLRKIVGDQLSYCRKEWRLFLCTIGDISQFGTRLLGWRLRCDRRVVVAHEVLLLVACKPSVTNIETTVSEASTSVVRERQTASLHVKETKDDRRVGGEASCFLPFVGL